MKCISCGTENNLRERTGNFGKCVKCNHAFVFEPTSMGTTKVTDPMFAKAISDISINNTLFFTPKQIFYMLDNRLRRKAFSLGSFGCTYIFLNVWVTGFFGGFGSMLFSAIGLGGFLEAAITANIIYQIINIIYLLKNTTSPKLNNASRKASAKALRLIGGFILILGIAASIFVFNSLPMFVIAVLLGMSSIYLGTIQLNKTGIPQEILIAETQVKEWLNRWQEINGNILKLLPQPQQANQPTTINPDVTAYSFDRLIVCDSPDIAQFLIANNFHFENNCAILSITGYPQSIFQTTMDMLRRNPNLQVYALHDCTSKGVSLLHRLRNDPTWFKNSNQTIINIGISPRQVLATKKGIFIETSPMSGTDARQLISPIRQELSTAEIQWLELGNFVSLESFPPQKLIQIIQAGIANTKNLDSDDSLIIAGGSDTYIYASQSFG